MLPCSLIFGLKKVLFQQRQKQLSRFETNVKTHTKVCTRNMIFFNEGFDSCRLVDFALTWIVAHEHQISLPWLHGSMTIEGEAIHGAKMYSAI